MALELSYVIITPYTILKSRTGGVIARLLSRTDVELVGAQIFTPSQELADKYADEIARQNVGKDSTEKLLSDYVRANFAPANGNLRRVMMLLFKGENACSKLYSVAGKITAETRTGEKNITGESIRDTYADLVFNQDGSLQYFEPAVLTPATQQSALGKLKIFAEFAAGAPNIVSNYQCEDKKEAERTLVIIKPDNWRFPSSKPGNIIDMFSRTGLRIVGCKIYQMSVADALEFYGPVRDVLREKLAPKIGQQAKEILEKELQLKLKSEDEKILTGSVGMEYADNEFSKIVEFMSGLKPENCPPQKLNDPGLVKCMVLVYEGKNAVKKIRDVLGPTDPTKAPAGTIRREFGYNVMINTAHASDSPENAKREMEIIRIQKNGMPQIINDFLKEYKP